MKDKTNEYNLLYSFCITQKTLINTLSFFEVIPQLLHIALTWSMIYLKPSANNFFSPVRSHVWTAFLPSSLSASKSPRNMYSSGNCTWRDVHCMSAKFAHRQGGLNWESLTQRRETARLCALFKTYKGERAWINIRDRLQASSYLSRVDHKWKIKARQ